MSTAIDRLADASIELSPIGSLSDPHRCARLGNTLIAIQGTDDRTLVRADLDAPSPAWTPIAKDVFDGDSVGPVAIADATHGRLLVASLRSVWLLEIDAAVGVNTMRDWDLHSETSTPMSVSLAADSSGKVLAMVERERVYRMTPDSHERVIRYDDPHFSRVCVSPRGDVIATGREDGRVEICDAKTLRVIRRLDGLGATVLAMAFSPDGRKLAAADDTTRAFVWDLDAGTSRRLDGVAKIVRFEWTADGSGLVAISLTRHLAAWDLADTNTEWHPRAEQHFHDLGTRYFIDGVRIDDSRFAVVIERTGVSMARFSP